MDPFDLWLRVRMRSEATRNGEPQLRRSLILMRLRRRSRHVVCCGSIMPLLFADDELPPAPPPAAEAIVQPERSPADDGR